MNYALILNIQHKLAMVGTLLRIPFLCPSLSFFVFLCLSFHRSDGSSDRSFKVVLLSYFSFQAVLHDWYNKGRDMFYPVCGMVHIKEPLLLIGKSSPCGDSGFPLSLPELSFTICLTPYNRK